jgi:hypothetical protein
LRALVFRGQSTVPHCSLDTPRAAVPGEPPPTPPAMEPGLDASRGGVAGVPSTPGQRLQVRLQQCDCLSTKVQPSLHPAAVSGLQCPSAKVAAVPAPLHPGTKHVLQTQGANVPPVLPSLPPATETSLQGTGPEVAAVPPALPPSPECCLQAQGTDDATVGTAPPPAAKQGLQAKGTHVETVDSPGGGAPGEGQGEFRRGIPPGDRSGAPRDTLNSTTA